MATKDSTSMDPLRKMVTFSNLNCTFWSYCNVTNSTSIVVNVTESIMPQSDCMATSVHDKIYNSTVRIISLYLLIVLGVFGGAMVLVWMWTNKRLKSRLSNLSRVNSLILNLTIADLLVMFLASLPQLVWEYQEEREWLAGAFLCKTVKFFQSFTLMASTNMVVIIAIDRHQAITRPLKTPIPVWKLAGFAWLMAVLGSTPMFYVFRIRINNDGVTKCENNFRGQPPIHRQAFLTYVTIIVFVIPILVLLICYTRIFLKISRKANEGMQKRHSIKPGKVYLERSATNTLPKAKIKTLKMTFVIVVVYLVSGIPYFIAELIMSYGNHCLLSDLVYSVLGSVAIANSSTNPFVFLLFNFKGFRSKSLKRSSSDGIGSVVTARTLYSSASTRSDYVGDSKNIYQVSVKYKWNVSPNSEVEMTSVR